MSQLQVVRQKTPYGCGAACVAIVAGVSFEEGCRLVETTSYTRSIHLSKALAKVGIKCADKATRLRPGMKKPNFCIVRFHHTESKRWSHWVVYKDGIYYDPALDGIISEGNYEPEMYETSYLEIGGRIDGSAVC